METFRQTCQSCGSVDLRNIITREAGRPDRIYVRCVRCRELVAMYELRDYYHHGKGAESFLRFHNGLDRDSGRDVLRLFEAAKKNAVEGFEKAATQIDEQAPIDEDT